MLKHLKVNFVFSVFKLLICLFKWTRKLMQYLQGLFCKIRLTFEYKYHLNLLIYSWFIYFYIVKCFWFLYLVFFTLKIVTKILPYTHTVPRVLKGLNIQTNKLSFIFCQYFSLKYIQTAIVFEYNVCHMYNMLIVIYMSKTHSKLTNKSIYLYFFMLTTVFFYNKMFYAFYAAIEQTYD